MDHLTKIKRWVKENGGREKFAELLGVSLGTVHNWFSGAKQIPEGRMRLILRLMQSNQHDTPAPQFRAVAFTLTEEERTAAERAAAGKPLDLFAREAVLEKVADILSRDSSLPAYGESKEPFA